MNRPSSTRLRYREIEKSDFSFFYSLYSNPQVMQYTYYDVCDESQAKKIFDEIFEKGESTDYIVHLEETDEEIGIIFCGSLLDHPHGGIMYFGYLLSPVCWGKGYATEMAKTIVSYLFETTHIHKITADCHIENTNSEKILIKLGMKKEGISRKARYKQNEWKDEVNYGMLREEWEDLSKQ